MTKAANLLIAGLQKKAILDGPEWQNWMMRKDVVDPANMQHLRSQDNGYLTSFLASAILGGGLGLLGNKITGGKNTADSALGGAATGAGLAMLANLVGKGAGYVTPTRTKVKHDKYQNGGTAAEWLIPGVANYNKVKTYGYALHGREKDRETEAKTEERKIASFHKQALQSVNALHEKGLAGAGASKSTQENYTSARNANGPAWYNPLDWLNFGQYAKTDLAQEATRKQYIDYLQWRKYHQAQKQQQIWDQQRQQYQQQKQQPK